MQKKSKRECSTRILIVDSESDTVVEDLKLKVPSNGKDLFAEVATEQCSSNDSKPSIEKPRSSTQDENDEPTCKKAKEDIPKRYTQKYKKEWENKPEFKPWLSASIHGDTYFYCKFCKKDYKGAFSDINKHMTSKKHITYATTPPPKVQKFKFKGLLCPVFTPFINAGKATPDINLKAIPQYARFLAAANVRGILINDVVSEGMSLTLQERKEVTSAWAEVCKKSQQLLMVQIGGAPLKDVFELVKHAEKCQVEAVVILPDLYNKPQNHLDLIRYLKLISEFTENIPILYHHHPKFTQVEIDIPSFLSEVVGEVDTFIGVIYTTNDIQQSTAALAVNRDKFTIFMGTDEAILAAAASGFTGIMSVSLNFLPKVVQAICQAVTQGHIKSAQESQNFLSKAMDAIGRQCEGVAAFKAATNIMTGTCGITMREPQRTPWEGTYKKIQGKLRELSLV